MTNAQTTKTILFALIDDPIDLYTLFKNCQTIVTILDHTAGLWTELNFAYKAKEIAERAIDALRNWETRTEHHKTLAKIKAQIDTFNRLADNYHQLQQESMR